MAGRARLRMLAFFLLSFPCLFLFSLFFSFIWGCSGRGKSGSLAMTSRPGTGYGQFRRAVAAVALRAACSGITNKENTHGLEGHGSRAVVYMISMSHAPPLT